MGVSVGVGVPVGLTEAASVGVGVDDNSMAPVGVGMASGDAASVEGADVVARSGVVGDDVGRAIAGAVGVSSSKSPKTMTPATMQAATTNSTLTTPRMVGNQRRSLLG